VKTRRGGIERYRQEHGVTDRQRAFGPQAKGLDRIDQQQAERTLRESQRALERQMETARVRDSGRSISIWDVAIPGLAIEAPRASRHPVGFALTTTGGITLRSPPPSPAVELSPGTCLP
jgi:hypothetical protein